MIAQIGYMLTSEQVRAVAAATDAALSLLLMLLLLLQVPL
jgi:hypothetical protein